MDFDLSTPEGIRALQKHFKKLPAAEALRLIDENRTSWGNEPFTRSMPGIRVVEGEDRTIEATFSSEEPVERWFGVEILSHEKGAVDLKWLRSGNAPALWMHDPRQHIGVISKASHDSEARSCACRMRLAKDDEGEKQLARCRDGITCNTSVGYRIMEWERTDDPADEEAMPTYRATKWKPHEVSLVSTPADETVGVGRSRMFRTPDTNSTSTTAVTLPTRTPPSPTMEPTAEQIATNKAEAARAANEAIAAAVKAERKRINALNAIRTKYDPTGKLVTDEDFARFSEDAEGGENALRSFLMDKIATADRTENRPNVTVTEARDQLPFLYALRDVVREMEGGAPISGRMADDDKALRIASVSAFGAGARSRGQLIVPSEFVRGGLSRMPSRNLSEVVRSAENAQQFTNGGALVGVTFAPTIIEYLRPSPVLERAGAMRMSGVQGGPGTIRFPKQVGDIYGTWAASQVASTPSVLPFGAVDASPKRLIAQVQIDKQLLMQESFDVQAYIQNSVMKQFALSLDLAGLIGNGNGMPLGILNTPNIQAGTVTFNGPSASSGTLAPQYNNFLLFLSNVLAANAGSLGKRSYITSPQSMINWAGVPKATPAATQTVNDKWMLEFGVGGKEFSVLGSEVFESTYLHSLPTAYSSAGFTLPVPDLAIYGPFNQYMFLEWAGMEVIYDPYTQAAKDLIVLTFRMYADGICQQPTAFVTSSNAGNVVYV